MEIFSIFTMKYKGKIQSNTEWLIPSEFIKFSQSDTWNYALGKSLFIVIVKIITIFLSELFETLKSTNEKAKCGNNLHFYYEF